MKYLWMVALVFFMLGCSVVKNPETGKVDRERILLTVKTVLNLYGDKLPIDPQDVACFNAGKKFVDSFQNSTDMLVILHDYSVVKKECKGKVDVDAIWKKL